ncbi:LysE family translocator [Nocardiopsis mangrovi]|uniref:LysE family translocator n=1 Tax=Nocardiopsis mangrovi TaxID=1179818 RepID=A0ABV9DXZ2_9ACTN
MDLGMIAAFWVTAALLIVVPGADWAFVLGTAVKGGFVVPAVGGLALGYACTTAVVAAGVGALVVGSPALLAALTLAGGAYLTWIGAMAVARTDGPPTPTAAAIPATTGWRTLSKGVGVSGLNPKGLLILFALLPQFTTREDGWPMPAQIGVLGLTFTISCAIFYLALGTWARSILHTRPAAAHTIARLAGAAMFLIGLTLVIEHLVR